MFNAAFSRLRTASPVALELLAVIPGDHRKEREMHDLFGEYRLHGEWFRHSPMMDDLIAAAGWPPQMWSIARKREQYLMEYLEEHFRR